MIKEKIPYILLAVLAILLGIIIFNFYGAFPTRNNSTESWKTTASIINGLITPILTSFSIILIWMTWQTSKKELEATNNALELDKAIKVLSAMLDASAKLFERKIPYKQKAQAYNSLVKVSGQNQKHPLYKTLENDRAGQQTTKYKFFCILSEFTHQQCFTKFGEHEFAPSIDIHNLTGSDLVKEQFKMELMCQYFEDKPESELAKPILRFLDILNFIEKYDHNLEIRNVLIDLFLFNVDDMIITLLAETPVRKHEIYKIISEG